MKYLCTGLVLCAMTNVASGEAIIFTNEAQYRSELASLGLARVHESFENETVWQASRNTIINPGRTASVASQGIVWTSNYPQNEIATGNVGGSAPDGTFALYSLPHGLTTDGSLSCDNSEVLAESCYQNDGIKIESESGDKLYGFGGRIDTANSGKVTFLLDGVDINGNTTDNVDNVQREGEFADNWVFVGVIDTDGFLTAELRELRGKDFQQVLLFTDDFTIGIAAVPLPAAFWLFGASLLGLAAAGRRRTPRIVRT